MKLFSSQTLLRLLLSVGLLVGFNPLAKASEVSFESDHQLPIVYLNLAVKSGAVSDPQHRLGLTHFMGEMLMRGTRHHSKAQIEQALDQMGAKLDIEVRAESLILRGAVLSSQIHPFLSLLLEIATEPSFSEEEISRLRSEVISILQEELGNDSTLAARKFTEFLFQGHPYGYPIIGKKPDIKRITRAELIEHHRNLFQPQSLLIIGSGDTNEDIIQDWTKQVEAKLLQKNPIKEHQTTRVQAPSEALQRRLQIIDKPDRTQTQINLGQIGIKMDDPQFFPLHVGNHALGGGSFSAILMTEIRVKRGWSYGAYSNFRFGLQPRSWQVHLFPAAQDAPAALAYTLKLLEEIKAHGITQEQFLFAQKSLINSAGFIYNTPKKRVENTLLEKTLQLPDGYMKSFAKHIQQVNLKQVNQALQELIRPDHFSISILGTASQLKDALINAAHVKPEEISVIPYTQE